MAPDPKKQSKLNGQVKAALEVRRALTSSSDEELAVVQRRKKIKAKKQPRPVQEHLTSSCKNEVANLGIGSSYQQNIRFALESPQEVENRNDDQMYGKDFDGDDMCELKYNIYCRKKIHNMAICSSHKASHVARKLLEGVFKPETLNHCTLTGMRARAQGPERQSREVICLDFVGRNAIVEFSRELAKERNWTEQTVEYVERSMSQRICEIKRSNQHNL